MKHICITSFVTSLLMLTTVGVSFAASSSPNATANSVSCDPINWTCGASNGYSFPSAPTVWLCATGSPSFVSMTPTWWAWTCNGALWWTSRSCYADRPIDGVCGIANGATYTPSVPPSTWTLCSIWVGTTPLFIWWPGGWIWSWSCWGIAWWNSASCGARAVPEQNNICWSANGGTYPNAVAISPATLCQPWFSAVAWPYNPGPYTWICTDGAGTDVMCGANTSEWVCGWANMWIFTSIAAVNAAWLCIPWNTSVPIPPWVPGPITSLPPGWPNTLWNWDCLWLSGSIMSCSATYGDPSCYTPPQPNILCNDTRDPVCWCDGVTYTNICHATKAGVGMTTSWACALAYGSCGDGVINIGEQCDDGALNGLTWSSCDNLCQIIIDPLEICDLETVNSLWSWFNPANIVSYTMSDVDDFGTSPINGMKLQPIYHPSLNYAQFVYNFLSYNGTMPAGQTQGDFDTNNLDAYYLWEMVVPLTIADQRWDPKDLLCVWFELKAKWAWSILSTDSLSLMTKDATPLPSTRPWNKLDWSALATYFNQSCAMNPAQFTPYNGSNIPFSINKATCGSQFVSSITGWNNHIYVWWNDDHTPDYVKVNAYYH